ncbi:MAG: MBL fold metallo-hydrolase [Bacteroidia bacterium]|nr:MBL fold metallo-hydrolase [Bacteroidia bacterium]
MKKFIPLLVMLFGAFAANAQSDNLVKVFEKDTFDTSKGKIVITFFGHSSLMIEAGRQVIYIDPVSAQADFSTLPKAGMVLITHEHGDHLDKKALALITEPQTITIVSQSCKDLVDKALVFTNGMTETFGNFKIEAVPAYNIVNKRADGIAYHPKGNGNGYVINYGSKRIYIGGDTENIPEMANLKNIDIAFLPMNLPYTMAHQMAADAAKSFMPGILYPYHLGNTDPQLLVDLLKDAKIEVRIRKMK